MSLKLLVEGRLSEPKQFVTKGNKAGVNYSVAHEYKEKKGEDYIVKTQWVDCVQWLEINKTYEEKFKKGDTVLIEGYPFSEGYVSEGGDIKSKIKCIVQSIELK
ncbi:MAG: single-stranded DNA-binding protein [Mobilitalea sp.]